MRILLLGNSHIGCLKQARDENPLSFEKHDLQFLGSAGGRLSDVRVEGQVLVPNNENLRKTINFQSGGENSIDLSGSDAVVVVGMGGYLIYESTDSQFSIAVTEATLASAAQVGGPLDFVRKVRAAFPGPVFLVAAPLPSREIDRKDWLPSGAYERAISFMQKSLFDQVDVKFVGQPQETRASDLSTKIEYGVNAIKGLGSLTGEKPQMFPNGDKKHMNSEYGAIMLGEVVRLAESVHQEAAS